MGGGAPYIHARSSSSVAHRCSHWHLLGHALTTRQLRLWQLLFVQPNLHELDPGVCHRREVLSAKHGQP
jgi:hypothetical protein